MASAPRSTSAAFVISHDRRNRNAPLPTDVRNELVAELHRNVTGPVFVPENPGYAEDVLDATTRQGLAPMNGSSPTVSAIGYLGVGQIGVLTPGAQADLTVFSLDRLRPIASHLGAVVSHAESQDVTAVIVDGVPRKWAGRVLGVDRQELAREAEASRDRLLKAGRRRRRKPALRRQSSGAARRPSGSRQRSAVLRAEPAHRLQMTALAQATHSTLSRVSPNLMRLTKASRVMSAKAMTWSTPAAVLLVRVG
jgi:hypothetical protein